MDTEVKELCGAKLYARLFGGVFSRIEECIPVDIASPMYSRAIKMLDTFLEKKFNVNVLEEDVVNWIDSPVLDALRKGENPLACLCEIGNLELAKILLSNRGKGNLGIKDGKAFQNACRNGHLEVVKWFLELYPKTKLENGLMTSCENGHVSVFKFLVERCDANLNFCLTTACVNGRLEMAKFISDAFPDACPNTMVIFSHPYNVIQATCGEGHLEVLKWLVEKYPKLDIPDDDTFCLACREGHLEVAKWLVEKYPNISSPHGNALFSACVGGHLHVAIWLKEIYPEITVNSSFIINYAVQQGHLEVAKWLVEKCPDIKHIQLEDFAIFYARRNLNMLSWISETFPVNKDTAVACFRKVCQDGNLEVAKFLVEKYNIDTDVRDNFAMAKAYKNTEIIEWLVQRHPHFKKPQKRSGDTRLCPGESIVRDSARAP